MESGGAYNARRAAALSGVPKSTVHYWARQGILVPSVSPERVKLWSYQDLVALRLVYWLRQTKSSEAGHDVPPTKMAVIRAALNTLRGFCLDGDVATTVAVDASGNLLVRPRDGAAYQDVRSGQLIGGWASDLLAPFPTEAGAQGPDLRAPRPLLRINPGKLSGAPHVAHTRLETQALYALARRGLSIAELKQMYPFAPEDAIAEALDLESQLERNLSVAA
jgi:uncharacterized protein (DUF433 family)